jgi:hypothetical protein
MVALVPVLFSILLVLPILRSSSTSGGRAAASGICRLGRAAVRLLVLLPRSARVLPVRTELPGWVDAGDTTDDSASAVEGIEQ